MAAFGALKRGYARFIFGSALRASDLVLTVSEFTRFELARSFPSRAAKLRVLPNALDTEIFHPDPERPAAMEGQYVLFVGNLKPHKNLAAAAAAVKILGRPRFRLAVVGADSGFIHGPGRELRHLRSEAELSFLGQVDDAELRRLYSHASCLVFPSLYEGFGYPLLEAMACGCPVVASDIPPLRETGGEAALYRDPASPRDFAQGMAEAVEEGERRSALIARGLERIRLFTFPPSASPRAFGISCERS